MIKLIKISDTHYIVVNDSEIKGNDFGWDVYEKKIFHAVLNWKGQTKNRYFKITHSTQPLYLNDFWAIKELKLSEVEEAINGYSVEKMAESKYPIQEHTSDLTAYQSLKRSGYIEGFKAHQELVKDKLFTIEDLEKAYNEGLIKYSNKSTGLTRKQFIQSLLPKTEWDIKFDEQGKIKLL